MSDAIRRPLVWSQTKKDIHLIVNVFDTKSIIVEIRDNVINFLGFNGYQKFQKTPLFLWSNIDPKNSKYIINGSENTVELTLRKKQIGVFWNAILFGGVQEEDLNNNSKKL